MQAENSGKINQYKKRKRRSPNYPYLSLRDALDKAEVVFDSEHNNYCPVDAVASLWKASPKSSSLQKSIAALVQFGLFDEKGSGSKREVKVSDLAVNILVPPDQAERLSAIRDAALAPKLHSELWARYNTRLPKNDNSIMHYLVSGREEGVFNKDAAVHFIKSFRDTLAFARLEEGGEIPSGNEAFDTQNEDKTSTSPEASVKDAKPKEEGPFFSTPRGQSANAESMIELPITLPSLKIAAVRVPKTMTNLEFESLLATLSSFRGALVREQLREHSDSNENDDEENRRWIDI
ncbi:hypothetical protein [Gimesia chilikensis]|uniref:hypothetical protein n=1 Tax=Gimesia chilikensis TaxID=2605989 RepID=UPI001188073C|nr:hypothetical protein [Gimesia chilikensis]QDT83109.1 hypothetical protein MalM14_07400 [Gimesia chilikensis]